MMTRDQRLVLAIAILASFVSFLDGTVVTVALPAIAAELGGGLTTQQWVYDAYLITLGALILVAGSLSDVFGRVRILRIGLIGFGLASIAIAAAPSAMFLIIARAVQGVAGALLVPSSLALITAVFPERERGRAIGIWTGATTVAMLLGPVLGGAFVDLASWRFVFLINVLPIGATLWLLAIRRSGSVQRRHRRVDWPGAVLCSAGLGAGVFALIEQPRFGWSSPVIWVTLSAGVSALAGFVVRQRFAAAPMMPLSMFRVRNFWAGNLETAFVYAALSLNGFVLAVYLQQGAGLSATLAGLATLPSTVLMIVLSPRIGTLATRLGPRVFMGTGPVAMAIGSLLLLTVSTEFSYLTQVLPGVVLFGLGLSLTVSPLTSTILDAIEPDSAGIASAVNNAVSRVAGLLAVAALGALIGGSLDLGGFHRSAVVVAALMTIGGAIGFLGIRNRPTPTGIDRSARPPARNRRET